MAAGARACGLLLVWVSTWRAWTGAEATARSQFPCDFQWGTATSSYQVEGAYNVDGRAFGIWDTFSREPGRTFNGDTGDEACEQYFLYEGDVELMNNMKVNAYRMSISWPRVLPDGTVGSLNEAGLAHYDRVIDALVAGGITPWVNLYHWDLPQALEDRLGGWLSPKMPDLFAEFARVIFDRLGDRVKFWMTINEPRVMAELCYGDGIHAPGRCSNRTQCPQGGNSETEPYIVAHHAILAHAKAVDVYRREFQQQQGGQIGIALDGDWSEPLTDSPEDVEAAERRQQFQHGWFWDPIYFGDYPAVMRDHVGDRLPRFTRAERRLVKGSADYAAINHYTSIYVANGGPPTDCTFCTVRDDYWTVDSKERNGVPIGDRAFSDWLYVVPFGIRKIINWVADRYGNPPIYISENGRDEFYDESDPIETTLNDQLRIDYYTGYLENVQLALGDGANLKGYFAWSLLDNFEWAEGYKNRFGFHYVNFTSPKKERIARESVSWFRDFIESNQGGCDSVSIY